MNSPAGIPADKQEILFTAAQIQTRVRELAAEIDRDYADGDLLLLCILRGGVVFLSDLMRAINVPHSIDFVALSSYETGARESSGQVRITLDLKTPVAHRDVLLVEDIVDTGRSLAFLMELLHAHHPRSLEVCVLLDKTDRRKVAVPLRYRGFSIPDRFVFGYGLDIDERGRNLPYIAAAKENETS
jgi:hypoxanthine phosphoribosyltransferase